MKDKSNSFGYWASRFSVAAMLLMSPMGTLYAQKGSPLHFGEATIVAPSSGSQQVENTLSLYLDNPDNAVSSFEMVIYLPKGVTFDYDNKVDNFVANESRISSDDFDLDITQRPDYNVGGKTAYKLTLFHLSKFNIPGKEGKLADLKLNVDKNFYTGDQTIDIARVFVSDCDANKVFSNYYEPYKFANKFLKYKMEVDVGALYMVDEFLPVSKGEVVEVKVGLNNTIKLRDFSCNIKLPEGMVLAQDEKGKSFVNGAHLPKGHRINHKVLDDGSINVTATNFSMATIGVAKDHLFSFYVKSDKELAPDAAIVIDNVNFSDDAATPNSHNANIGGLKLAVKDLTALYAGAVEEINQLKQQQTELYQKVDQFVVENESLKPLFDAEKGKVDQAVAALDKRFGEFKEKMESPVLDNEKAAVSKALASLSDNLNNEVAYKPLMAVIDAVQKELNDAKAVVAKEYKDVVASFDATVAGLQKQIDALKENVEAQHKEVKLNAESVADTKAISEGIVKMVADAKVAQQQFVDNEANFKNLSVAVDTLKDNLFKAQDQMKKECKDVAENYNARFYELNKLPVALAKELQTAYESKELAKKEVADKFDARVKEVAKTLEELVAEIKADQANLDANKRLAEELDGVKAQVVAAQKSIETEYKDVAAQFANAFDGVNKNVEALAADVQKRFEAKELNAESALNAELLKAVNDGIAKVVADAKAAQEKFDNDHTANNKAAVENYKKELAELKAGLFEEVKAEVAAYQHKGDYSAAVQKVADMIAAEEAHLAQPEYVGSDVNLDANNYEEGAKIAAAVRELQKTAADAEFAHLLALGYNEGEKALQNVAWNAAAYVDADQAVYNEKSEKLVAAYEALVAEYRGLAGEAFVGGFQAVLAQLPELNAKVDALRAFLAENKIVKGCMTPGETEATLVDYTTILNTILESEYNQMPGDPASVEYQRYFKRADVSNDGKLMVNDLTKLVDIIRGVAPQPTSAAPAASNASEDHIALAVSGQGSAQRIAVLLNNVKNYTAAQMDIVLPEGIRLVGESLGNRACGHQLYSNDLNNGAHRVIIASMENALMDGSNGAVLYLDVEVSDSYQGAGIEVANVVVADAASNAYQLNSIAGGEATGIGSVIMNANGQGQVYNMAGQLQNGLNKGVNIVKMNDGSVKKVYRK